MNKKKFVELIRTPEEMSVRDLAELQKVINEAPYFQSAYTVMAKGSRLLKQKAAPMITKRAAMYATNRDVFKGYLISQTKSRPIPVTSKATSNVPSSLVSKETAASKKAPHLLNETEHDKLIKEIYDNLEQWKTNRDHYLEFDKEHPQDIIIDEVIPEALPVQETAQKESIPDSVELLKSQVADEVQAEESEASKAVEEVLLKKTTPNQLVPEEVSHKKDDPKDQTAVESEPEIEDIESSGSIYSFGSKIPEPESLPPTQEPKAEEIGLISSEELSAIVDETEAEIIAEEEEQNKDTPTLEPLSEISEDELETTLEAHEEDEAPKLEEEKEDTPPLEPLSDISEDELSTTIEPPEQEAPKIESEVKETPPSAETEDSLDLIDSHEDVDEISIPNEEGEIPQKVEKTETTDEISDETLSETKELEVVSQEETDEEVEEIEADLKIDKDKSTSDSEAELNEIENRKKELRLHSTASDKPKKFRLSVLKRPIKFTKPKKEKPKNFKVKQAEPEEAKKSPEKKVAAKKTAEPKETKVKKTTTKKKTTTAKKTASTTKKKPTTKKASTKTDAEEKKKPKK